eukprot:scaffold133372_cov82-Phaeocystis_antarctica.AAC.2
MNCAAPSATHSTLCTFIAWGSSSASLSSGAAYTRSACSKPATCLTCSCTDAYSATTARFTLPPAATVHLAAGASRTCATARRGPWCSRGGGACAAACGGAARGMSPPTPAAAARQYFAAARPPRGGHTPAGRQLAGRSARGCRAGTLPGDAVQVGREAVNEAAHALLAVRREVTRREQVGPVAALRHRLLLARNAAVDCRRATRAARRLARIDHAPVGGLLLGLLPQRLERRAARAGRRRQPFDGGVRRRQHQHGRGGRRVIGRGRLAPCLWSSGRGRLRRRRGVGRRRGGLVDGETS